MTYIIKKLSLRQQLFQKIKSKSEDIFLTLALYLVKLTKSKKLSNWMQSYTKKKIPKMQLEIVRMNWNKNTLNQAVTAIRAKESEQ